MRGNFAIIERDTLPNGDGLVVARTSSPLAAEVPSPSPAPLTLLPSQKATLNPSLPSNPSPPNPSPQAVTLSPSLSSAGISSKNPMSSGMVPNSMTRNSSKVLVSASMFLSPKSPLRAKPKSLYSILDPVAVNPMASPSALSPLSFSLV